MICFFFIFIIYVFWFFSFIVLVLLFSCFLVFFFFKACIVFFLCVVCLGFTSSSSVRHVHAFPFILFGFLKCCLQFFCFCICLICCFVLLPVSFFWFCFFVHSSLSGIWFSCVLSFIFSSSISLPPCIVIRYPSIEVIEISILYVLSCLRISLSWYPCQFPFLAFPLTEDIPSLQTSEPGNIQRYIVHRYPIDHHMDSSLQARICIATHFSEYSMLMWGALTVEMRQQHGWPVLWMMVRWKAAYVFSIMGTWQGRERRGSLSITPSLNTKTQIGWVWCYDELWKGFNVQCKVLKAVDRCRFGVLGFGKGERMSKGCGLILDVWYMCILCSVSQSVSLLVYLPDGCCVSLSVSQTTIS